METLQRQIDELDWKNGVEIGGERVDRINKNQTQRLFIQEPIYCKGNSKELDLQEKIQSTSSFFSDQIKNTVNTFDDNILEFPLVQAIKEDKDTDSFIPIKKWEGKVISVDITDQVFTAEIAELHNPDEILETDFDFSDIAEDDLKLVLPGSIFYWTVGYHRISSGNKQKTSVLKFRRLPSWTESDVVKSKQFLKEMKRVIE